MTLNHVGFPSTALRFAQDRQAIIISKIKNQNAIRLCIKLRRTRIVESLRSVFARGFAATSGDRFYRTAGGFLGEIVNLSGKNLINLGA